MRKYVLLLSLLFFSAGDMFASGWGNIGVSFHFPLYGDPQDMSGGIQSSWWPLDWYPLSHKYSVVPVGFKAGLDYLPTKNTLSLSSEIEGGVFLAGISTGPFYSLEFREKAACAARPVC